MDLILAKETDSKQINTSDQVFVSIVTKNKAGQSNRE
jgi:hypothetical protein